MRFLGAVIDMDGVLYLGESPIPGASGAIALLRSRGIAVKFITNNSSRTCEELARKLQSLGIPAKGDDIVTSALGAAAYVKEKGMKKAFVFGERGLALELEKKGITVLGADEAEKADAVVVGIDRSLSYATLTAAMRAVRAGAKFIATNEDPSWPSEEGFMPGGGAMVAALAVSSGKKPDAVLGKPSTYLYKLACRGLCAKPKETMFIGDRLNTDIVFGNRLGAFSVLVLTGVSSEKEARRAKGLEKPGAILKSIAEIGKIIGK